MTMAREFQHLPVDGEVRLGDLVLLESGINAGLDLPRAAIQGGIHSYTLYSSGHGQRLVLAAGGRVLEQLQAAADQVDTLLAGLRRGPVGQGIRRLDEQELAIRIADPGNAIPASTCDLRQ